jgi:hypothetical protein
LTIYGRRHLYNGSGYFFAEQKQALIRRLVQWSGFFFSWLVGNWSMAAGFRRRANSFGIFSEAEYVRKASSQSARPIFENIYNGNE